MGDAGLGEEGAIDVHDVAGGHVRDAVDGAFEAVRIERCRQQAVERLVLAVEAVERRRQPRRDVGG